MMAGAGSDTVVKEPLAVLSIFGSFRATVSNLVAHAESINPAVHNTNNCLPASVIKYLFLSLVARSSVHKLKYDFNYYLVLS